MQNQLAVAVVDAFREAGSASRVKRRRLDVFVKVGKHEIWRRRREKLLVFAHQLESASHWGFTVGQDDQPLDVGQLGQKRLHEVCELVIDEKSRRTRVIDRVGYLLGRQPHVDRLQDNAHHRDGKKGFKESVAIPIENSDGVAGTYADPLESACKSADAFAKFEIGETLQVAIDDLLTRGLGKRRVQQLLDQQRIVVGRGGNDDFSFIHRRPPIQNREPRPSGLLGKTLARGLGRSRFNSAILRVQIGHRACAKGRARFLDETHGESCRSTVERRDGSSPRR